ncbi:hypothetical protein Clacol_008135 [Clathrus columnatus]|uniref:Uncharacterized protein n=1 Tax=Clathrus columnatus TaxID=1419009 RepID=A0AAV5AK65_9AGAM|nr:hypothetical protein Clacol_008135 [Clathrus columnatus]
MDAETPRTLRHRKTFPDVPEDISTEDHLAHLNDPNYSFHDAHNRWSQITFEFEEKASIDTPFSSGKSYVSDDLETGSHTEYSRSDSPIVTSKAEVVEEGLLGYFRNHSPYPEVRASVSPTDDPSLPVDTFRAWFLGIIVSTVFTGLNVFFNARAPNIYITGLIVQVIVMPLGKLLEYILPTTIFQLSLPFTSKKFSFTFNPGPFNIKEHVLITVMTTVCLPGPFAYDVVLSLRVNGTPSSRAFQILFTLSSQLFGFALAGFVRRIIVWPSMILWPGALVNCAVWATLHKTYGKREKKHISRLRFFGFAATGAFLYYFIPGYLFTALSVFNWACWIAPQNPIVNALLGTQTGLGMSILTFDWNQISWVGNPLISPWWTQVNIGVGGALFYWLLAPALYFTNTFYSKYLPISAPVGFDNTGFPYDQNRILVNGTFSEELYSQYSPLYLPITFALAYGLTFMACTSAIVHTFLWYRKELVRGFRSTTKIEQDIFYRLNARYKPTPNWWYIVLGVISFFLGIIAIEIDHTGLPIWAYMISLLVAAVYVVPGGIILGTTNQLLPVNVVGEVLGGFMVPGRPLATLLVKFVTSLTEIAHYMKIPTRSIFLAQVISTIITSFLTIGIIDWQFANIADFCSPENTASFTCPNIGVFNTAITIWGGIGWFLFIGAVLPIPFYFAAKRWPTSKFKYVNIPVACVGASVIPPASGINLASWVLVGFIFQYYMRKYHLMWWIRFNYILSAALDAGTLFSVIIIFLALQLPKGGIELNWWGNTVWQNTADAIGLPALLLAPNQTFGPLPHITNAHETDE